MSETIWCAVDGCREHEHRDGGPLEERASMVKLGPAFLRVLYRPDTRTFTHLCAAHFAEAQAAVAEPEDHT